MTKNTNRLNDIWTAFALFVLFGSLVGCVTPVKLIADYDEQTDVSITELQRKFETFFVGLEGQIGTPAASFDNHKSFYDEIRVDISSIALRVNALPRNDITAQQIRLLQDNVDLLMDVHREGIAAIELVDIPRNDFNTALSSILKLELAKRRGE